MSDEKLDEIKILLEDIKGILQLSHQDKIEEVKNKIIRSGSMEETVYKLCDGINTTIEIMAVIQKDQKYTNTVLGNLRQKGLIRVVERNGKKVHEQRF